MLHTEFLDLLEVKRDINGVCLEPEEIVNFTGFIKDQIDGIISPVKMEQSVNKTDSIFRDLDDIYKRAIETQEIYDHLLLSIGSKSNAQNILTSKEIGLKSLNSTVGKIRGEYSGEDLSKLRDLLRGSIVYDDIDDIKHAINLFKKSDKIQKIFINNRIGEPLRNDIFMNIEFKNGFVAEVQLHITETLKSKQDGLELPKSYFNLDNYWKQSDFDILQNLKEGNTNGRSISKKLFLPTNLNLINGHDLYEMRRSLDKNNKEQNDLIFRLKFLEEQLNLYAREQYKLRTNKEFKF